MRKVYSYLYAYVLRLPFFLLVYSVVLIILGETNGLFPMLVIFSLLCVPDVLPDRVRIYVVIVSFVSMAIFVIFGMYVLAVITLIFTAYRPDERRTSGSIALIVCLSIVTIVATMFFDPTLAGICVRNLVIATVAIILA